MAACICWRLGFRQFSFHHIPRVPWHPAPVRLGTTTAFLACSGPLHLSDPGQPSDPGPPSEFLPAAPGIQQGASRRSDLPLTARHGQKPHIDGRTHGPVEDADTRSLSPADVRGPPARWTRPPPPWSDFPAVRAVRSPTRRRRPSPRWREHPPMSPGTSPPTCHRVPGIPPRFQTDLPGPGAAGTRGRGAR
jgi:hypothetical protein